MFFSNALALQDGGIGQYLLSLSILCPLFFILLAIIEFEVSTGIIRKFAKKICCCCKKSKKAEKDGETEIDEMEDSDVIVSHIKYIF